MLPATLSPADRIRPGAGFLHFIGAALGNVAAALASFPRRAPDRTVLWSSDYQVPADLGQHRAADEPAKPPRPPSAASGEPEWGSESTVAHACSGL